MERNAELLRKVADKIMESPEEYDQGVYSSTISPVCGFVACIAGHDMLESGQYYYNQTDALFRHLQTDDYHEYDEAASKVLGLSIEEGSRLFSGLWKPKGASRFDEEAPVELVAKALYALADGADVEDVSYGNH